MTARTRAATTIELQIPDKESFRIGEVARLLGVKTSVLRYWETEFRTLRPKKSSSGQRIYSRKNVERLLVIRELLYERGFTIAGARKQLAQGPGAAREPTASASSPDVLEEIQAEAEQLLRLADG